MKRNFLHVDDFNNAVNLLIKSGVLGEAYNVGSKDEIQIIDLAKIIL
jgi:dTDP-D-glucose 4,6-dehydratase